MGNSLENNIIGENTSRDISLDEPLKTNTVVYEDKLDIIHKDLQFICSELQWFLSICGLLFFIWLINRIFRYFE